MDLEDLVGKVRTGFKDFWDDVVNPYPNQHFCFVLLLVLWTSVKLLISKLKQHSLGLSGFQRQRRAVSVVPGSEKYRNPKKKEKKGIILWKAEVRHQNPNVIPTT